MLRARKLSAKVSPSLTVYEVPFTRTTARLRPWSTKASMSTTSRPWTLRVPSVPPRGGAPGGAGVGEVAAPGVVVAPGDAPGAGLPVAPGAPGAPGVPPTAGD